MSQPIKDYALIGNLRCAALAGRNGSIDWFCPPRFDAPACFSKLLGNEQHGFWQIAPEHEPSDIQRHYEPDEQVREQADDAVLADDTSHDYSSAG